MSARGLDAVEDDEYTEKCDREKMNLGKFSYGPPTVVVKKSRCWSQEVTRCWERVQMDLIYVA
jgi:hypothetical protein